MQPFEPFAHDLSRIGHVAAAASHGKHRCDDPAFGIVFVDVDIAATIMNGRVLRQDRPACLFGQNLRSGNEHALNLEGSIQLGPTTNRISASGKDHFRRDHFSAIGLDLPASGYVAFATRHRRAGKYLSALTDDSTAETAGVTERIGDLPLRAASRRRNADCR